MATSKVAEKIIEDAKQEAKQIRARHEAESENLKKEYQAKIDKRRAMNRNDAESLEKTITMRGIAKQRLAFSQELISRKQKMIDKVIREAAGQMSKSKDYVKFLQSLIAKSSEKNGELILNERDVKEYRQDLEKFLKKNDLQYTIHAGRDITGGVIIKKDSKTYLGSLDIISDLLKDEISIEAAKILFEGGSK